MSNNTSNASAPLILKSKVKKNHTSNDFQQCNSHVYACFQQPETINIIPYLTMSAPNKLCFDSNKKRDNSAQSDTKERFDKKQKQFKFAKIYHRQQKFKYAFSYEINNIITKLFKGLSQTVFIYGTQQTKKDKILIGQSQNSGFLLTTLSEIFQYCHEKQIQDEVTIKLSCMMYKNGAFTDVFGVYDDEQLRKETTAQQQREKDRQCERKTQKQKQGCKQNFNLSSSSIFCDDKLQKKYFLGVPQIIIRNMRTALKIINLICKKMQERRDQHEENTQNLIYTIKLELDTGYDRQTGEVFQYNIPKLHIIKLANPAVDNTLNGISKNNEWFINLFNFLQTQVRLQKHLKRMIIQNTGQITGTQQQKSSLQKLFNNQKSQQTRTTQAQKQNDQFTTFIKDVALTGVSDIHCFTSITNKMTSNQCLTAFIFNNYILAYKTKPTKTVLNIRLLKEQKNQIQIQLLRLFQTKQAEIKKQKQILKKHFPTNLSKQKQQSLHTMGTIKNNSFSKTKSTFNTKKPLNYTLSSKRGTNWLETFNAITQEQYLQEFDQNKLFLFKYIENINKFTQSCNLVEYQYSLVLGAACQRLNKYIFNEQIQEFYYAKKVSTQVSTGLKQSICGLMRRKKQMSSIKEKMMKKINIQISKLQSQIERCKNLIIRPQNQELMKIKKQRMFHLSKERQIYVKIFQLYDTMAYHYLFQNNKILMGNLLQTKNKVQEQLKFKNEEIHNINYQEILSNIKKGFRKRIQQKKSSYLADQQKQIQDEINQNLPLVEEEQTEENKVNSQQIYSNNTKQIPSNQKQKIATNQSLYKTKKLSPSKMQSLNKTVLKESQNCQRKGDSSWASKKKRNMDQLQNMFTNSNVGRMSRTQYK